MSPDYTDDLRLAHVLADDADSLSQSRFRALDLHVMSKPDLTPVTDADRSVEEGIRRTLAKTRPRDSVLGEEEGVTGLADRLSKKLSLPLEVWGATCIFLHKYLYGRKEPEEDMVMTSLGCLYLAAKALDHPRDAGSLAQAFVFDRVGLLYPRTLLLHRNTTANNRLIDNS